MGKKRVSVLGSENEATLKAKKAVKLEQKRLREGKTAKAPGLAGGQRVVDTAAESLAEYEEIQKRNNSSGGLNPEKTTSKKIIKVRSAAYKTAKAKTDITKTYTLAEALKLLKDVSYTKFDPTVELHLNLVKSGISATVDLPYSTGKVRRIEIATDVVIAQIESGQFDFDVLFATPAQMPKLVKLAKVLGPKGLMPNPKTGTVVDDPEAAVKKLLASNTITLRTEKSAPLIHTVVGKLSQPDKELAANIHAIAGALSPFGIIKVVLKSTMSPAIKLQV